MPNTNARLNLLKIVELFFFKTNTKHKNLQLHVLQLLLKVHRNDGKIRTPLKWQVWFLPHCTYIRTIKCTCTVSGQSTIWHRCTLFQKIQKMTKVFPTSRFLWTQARKW